MCNQIIDEFRFAIKCGGSAKKIQLTDTTALPAKKPSHIQKSLSDSSNLNKALMSTTSTAGANGASGQVRKECKKCQEMIRSELLDNITPQNALVCKHNSANNLSVQNPGLLIVDKDTAFDAHAAVLNSQMMPHLHMSHQSQSKKSPKSKKSDTNLSAIASGGDYILMQTLNKPILTSNSNSKLYLGTSNQYLSKQQNNVNYSDQREIPITINRFDDQNPTSADHYMNHSKKDPNIKSRAATKSSNVLKNRFSDRRDS